MLSPLRNRFGIPGVISVVALVFAMLGGAYAANNSSGGGNATASAKAKQGPKGPKGPKGATGPAGPAGAQGPAGPAGAKGDAGANGTNGATGATGDTGATGKSVTTGNATPTECPVVGGATVEVEGVPASKKKVCNGSPWTVGGVLPAEKTLTGVYNMQATAGKEALAEISFTLPLGTAPKATYVEGASAPGCPGVVSGVATADPGNLCLYKSLQSGNAGEEEIEPGVFLKAIFFVKPTAPGTEIGFPGESTGVAKTGTIFEFICASAQCSWRGTWAVTAE